MGWHVRGLERISPALLADAGRIAPGTAKSALGYLPAEPPLKFIAYDYCTSHISVVLSGLRRYWLMLTDKETRR
jgi:hypothetical protein